MGHQHWQPNLSPRRRRLRRHHPALDSSWLTKAGVVDYVFVSFLIISNSHRSDAQSTNNYFCGTSFSDASNNCNDRRHCPGATDEECGVAGQMCFSDTLCDASNGDGLSGTVAVDSFSALDLPYEDQANTRFCQLMGAGTASCIADLWCGDDNTCMEGMVCAYSDCHLHDVLASETENQEKQGLLEQQKEEHKILVASDPEDPIRNNFCGSTWEDASAKCGMWCMGEESDCPAGEGCFAQTTCYSDAGLVPSQSPTTYSPTTRSPTPWSDPINFKFCGRQWDTIPCTKLNHCPTGTECVDGETCFTSETCNIMDLTDEPTLRPTEFPTLPSDDPSYFKFCGKSYSHAADGCSIQTFCQSDDSCPSGASCFEGLPDRCNAFFMLHPDLKPTPEPSHHPTLPQPTFSPTITSIPTIHPTKSPTTRDDPRNMRFCGSVFDTVTCTIESHCPTGLECKNGEICFTKEGCNAYDLTMTPTSQPSLMPPTSQPSSSPTLPRNHASYFRFCGRTIAHATRVCSLETHCGFDGDCPSGTLCLDTPAERCDAFALLHPELNPSSIAPSLLPTTAAPITTAPIIHDDPGSIRFCGETWDKVNCSIESHCPTGNECPHGETCFTNERCNVHDLTRTRPSNPPSSLKIPTTSPVRETSLSLSTPVSQTYAPTTSKRKTTNPSLRPSPEPVIDVTQSSNMPTTTQQVDKKWCGKSQADANSNCGTKSMPCSTNSCPYGWECYRVDDQFCVSATVNNEQTNSPVSRPTDGSGKPSKSFTQSTNEPTQQHTLTVGPTSEYVPIDDMIETIVSTTAPSEVSMTAYPTYFPTNRHRHPIHISEGPSSDQSYVTAAPAFTHLHIVSATKNEGGSPLPSQTPTSAATNETADAITFAPTPSLRNTPNRSMTIPDDSIRYYDLSQWYTNRGGRSTSMNWINHATWTVLSLMLFAYR